MKTNWKRKNGYYLLLAGLVAWRLVGEWQAQAAPNPDQEIPSPEIVMARVWQRMELKDFKMSGVMKTAKNRYPITLKTKGREMVYEFQTQPLQIRVFFGPGKTSVHRRATSGKPWKAVEGKEKLETILDSDVTYEDIGMEFLNWHDIQPAGTDFIKIFDTWAYDAFPPDVSNYKKARLWISSDYIAPVRIDAYNAADQPIKRVEVNEMLKVGKIYVVKEMMISNLIPGRELSRSRTMILVREAEPGSGL